MRSPDAFLDYILDDVLGDVEMILHAGDITTRVVLERLEARGALAVCGNMDDYEVAGLLPPTRIVPAGGKQIGVIHGWGAKEGLERRIVERFRAAKPDLIVYGHTHVPFWGEVDGVRMFNPGSAGRMGRASTVGVIEIAGDLLEGQFISIESDVGRV
jgi:hypothetical protein